MNTLLKTDPKPVYTSTTSPRRYPRCPPLSDPKTPRSAKKSKGSKPDTPLSFSSVTPSTKEVKSNPRSGGSKPRVSRTPKKQTRVYYRKVVYDGGEFEVGDDVYVKRKDGMEDDDVDPVVEECRVCFEAGNTVMIECDDCLGGFHLKCLKPPLRKVPRGDWVCGFCVARKDGRPVEMPRPSEGKKLRRTMKEKLLSSDLWAARIERLWKELDGAYWMRCRWYMIPEETAVGRQSHNLRRELYRTNHSSDVEMETVVKHCSVFNPKEFSEASDEGDDVFYCEYEYDVVWHSFRRIADVTDDNSDERSEKDDEWEASEDWVYADDDSECEEEDAAIGSTAHKYSNYELAANSCKGRIFGIPKIGVSKIPEHVRKHKQSELERAKATLLLATVPKSLPCRNKEMNEISSFIRGALCDDNGSGRCLYIHGVPGTGKTMSVLSVMRTLKSEVDAGSMRPYCFIEVNGLKLASPENIYKVIYETLTGHRVGWKKALHFLNERFSDGAKVGENKPCVLLIDELDLLLTRSQSVLYNILDWPTKLHSNLIVIGIANTMNLPEKLLPRISSRMGIQRLCFGPYNYQQLKEIILSRLKGVNTFDELAVEYASRKVAAMSGDARRALEICRRAAELTDYRLKQAPHNSKLPQSSSNSTGKCFVGMSDIQAAIKEVLDEPHIQIMRTCSKLGKILLVAMVLEINKSGLGEITFEKLAATVSTLCSSNSETEPEWDSLLKVGCKLGECRVILCEEGSKHRLQKLQLNCSCRDVSIALMDCEEPRWLRNYL